MSWIEHKQQYEEIAHKIDPAVRLVTKDHFLWKVLAALTMVFTCGGIKYRTFLESYATTLGPIQGYPSRYRRLSTHVLVHEARHTKQARWFGLGIHPWVGLPLFAVFYLLLFLPLGFAFFRWRFEIDADLAMYRWALKEGYSEDWVRARSKRFARKVCGGNYGWSFPVWLGGLRGFEKAAERAIKEVRGQK